LASKHKFVFCTTHSLHNIGDIRNGVGISNGVFSHTPWLPSFVIVHCGRRDNELSGDDNHSVLNSNDVNDQNTDNWLVDDVTGATDRSFSETRTDVKQCRRSRLKRYVKRVVVFGKV